MNILLSIIKTPKKCFWLFGIFIFFLEHSIPRIIFSLFFVATENRTRGGLFQIVT